MKLDTLVRDPTTTALLTTDAVGLAAYKTVRDRAKKMDQIEIDINSVKSELQGIKELLKELLHRG